MKVSRNPSYLYQSRHGIYYFRTRIPLCIKSRYNTTKNEVRKSLNTRSAVVARKEARRLWVVMEDTDYMMNMDEIERQQEEANEGRKLLKRFLVAQIKSRETGILDGEEVGNYLADYEKESETQILFRKLTDYQVELLKKQLDIWEQEPEEKKNSILMKLKSEIEREDKEVCAVKEIVVTPAQKNLDNSPLLVDATENFLKQYVEKKSRGDSKIEDDTIDEYRAIYKEFIHIIGGNNTRCGDLNKDVIKQYDRDIWRVPTFIFSGKYKGKKLHEILKIREKSGDSIKGNSTIKKHVMRVKAFLRWGIAEEYISGGLDYFLSQIPDTKVSDKDKKEKFSDDDLKLLFNNAVYENGKFKHPSRYWIPLVAMFSGMRGNEIAQLYNDDIKCEGTIWYFDLKVDSKRNQKLKNTNASRKIPVHPQLIKLGFIDFAKKNKKSDMIFPDLRNEKESAFKKFGNNFNRRASSGWMVKCGVNEPKKSFHSFRHNVVDMLEKMDVNKRVGCFLVGHDYKGGFVSNYVKSDDLVVMSDVVRKLKYPCIDWSKIEKRRW